MKKILSIITTVLLLLVIAVSCAQDVTVDTQLYGAQGSGTFMLNGKYYNTLQEAVNARLGKGAKAAGANDDVIYLTRNAKGPGAKIDDPNISVIIDFAGWTYSFTDVTATQGSTTGTFGLSITGGADVTLKGLEQIDLHDATANLTMVYVEGADTKLTIEDAPKMKVEPTQYVFWAANGATLTVGSNSTTAPTTISGKIAATGGTAAESKPVITFNNNTTVKASELKADAAVVIINSSEASTVDSFVAANNTQIVVSGSGNVTVTDNNSKSTATYTIENTSSDTNTKVDIPTTSGENRTVTPGQKVDNDEDPEVDPTPTVARIGSSLYKSLADAVDAATAGQTVTLLKSIVLADSYTHSNPFLINKTNMILDLNSYEITVNENMSFIIQADGAKLTNGSIKGTYTDDGKNGRYAICVNACDKAIIEDVIVTGGIIVGGDPDGGYTPGAAAATNVIVRNCSVTQSVLTNRYAICAQNTSSVTIESGSFTNNAGGVLYGSFTAGDGGPGFVTITGGTFTGSISPTNTPDHIMIKGGVFTVDPTNLVYDGYVARKTGDVWTVSKADTEEVEADGVKMSLLEFAKSVNSGNNYEGKTVKLLKNIDLDGIAWTPIGNGDSDKMFRGTFDGQNNIISNLTVDSSAREVGFFGTVYGATIKNIVFKKARVNGTNTNKYAAVLVGLVGPKDASPSTTIPNTSVMISNIEIDKDSVVTGSEKVGSIAGQMFIADGSIIENVSSSASISGERVGGVMGAVSFQAGGTIIFENCQIGGTITTQNTSTSWAGGIIGHKMGGAGFMSHFISFNRCSVPGLTKMSGGVSSKLGTYIGCATYGTFEFTQSRIGDSLISTPVGLIKYMNSGSEAYEGISIDTELYCIVVPPTSDYSNSVSDVDCIYTSDGLKENNEDKDNINKNTYYYVSNMIVSNHEFCYNPDGNAILKVKPSSIAEGSKIQRGIRVAGYDYSYTRYAYTFDRYRVVTIDTPESEEFVKGFIWLDDDNFRLGEGTYYYLDPTPYVDLNIYSITSYPSEEVGTFYRVFAK